jgi:CRISP-associated protein Cas1
MQRLDNSVYVMSQMAHLHLEGEQIRIEIEGVKRRLPLHHVDNIVVFGDVFIKPALIRKCGENRIPISWFSRNGRFKGRLGLPIDSHYRLRESQYLFGQSETEKLEVAKQIIQAKTENSRQVLLRGARNAKDTHDASILRRAGEKIQVHQKQILWASDRDQLLGVEGVCAKEYFSVFKYLVAPGKRKDFPFDGRHKRPPRGKLNAGLSFLYTVAGGDCASALEHVGLDPSCGVFHEYRAGRRSLSLDLLEEFRAVLVDRLVLSLVNLGTLGEAHFEERVGGATMLNDVGRRIVLKCYQEKKQQKIKHPQLQQEISWGLFPIVQARLLAKVIQKDSERYAAFVAK